MNHAYLYKNLDFKKIEIFSNWFYCRFSKVRIRPVFARRVTYNILTSKIVGIMLQISFIILFEISLKIFSLCSILFFYASPSITISYLQFKLIIKVSYLTLVELLKTLISLLLMLVMNPK